MTGTPVSVFVYGILYVDANGNGAQERSETGIAGANLELASAITGVGEVGENNQADATGAPQPWRQSTVTSAVGAYAFEAVPEGDYILTISPPEGIVLRQAHQQPLAIRAQTALSPLPIGVDAVPAGVHLPLILR